MPYTPKTWANTSGGGTKVTAAELNRMEAGVTSAESASTHAGTVTATAAARTTAANTTSGTATTTAGSATTNAGLKIPKSTFTIKGGLLVGSGSGAVTQLSPSGKNGRWIIPAPDGPITFSDVYFNDFGTLGDHTVLGSEWEVYDSAGNAGHGLRRPSQVNVATASAGENSDGKALVITAENISGVLWSGGVQLTGYPQTYGQYEVRVRVDPDADEVTSGVFLLWPSDNDNPRKGEVDFSETFDFRDTRNPFKSFVHRMNPLFPDTPTDEVVREITHTGHSQADYTKLVLDWTPWYISLEINDGDPVFLTTDPDEIPHWDMNLCIQLDAWEDTPPTVPVKLEAGYVVVRELVMPDVTVGYGTKVTAAALADRPTSHLENDLFFKRTAGPVDGADSNLKTWDGTAWVQVAAKEWTGSAWVPLDPVTQYSDGTDWQT